MIYRTITIRADIAKDRLYRVLKVREDLDLFEFVIYVITSFEGGCDHLFSIQAGGIDYELPNMMEEDIYGDAENIMKAHIKDLPKRFDIEYDFGEDWEFTCVIEKKKEDLDAAAPVLYVDGKGAGIWEDNRWSLEMYYDGEIDPSTSEDDEENDFYMPIDFDFEHVSDQDNPLDAKRENRKLQISKVYLNDLRERWQSDDIEDSFDFDDDEEDVFDYGPFAEYVELADQAFDLMTKEKDYSQEKKTSLNAFRNACEKLKKEGVLPSRFGDLVEQYEEADLNTLILELSVDNPLIESDTDFLLDFINYLLDTFTFEFKHEETLKRVIFQCYEEQMDYGAAENFVNAWLSAYPESDEAKAAKIRLIIDLKRFKDGKNYLKELDLKNSEIGYGNYNLFLAARSFYGLTKDKMNFRWIDEVINDYDEKLLDDFSDIMDQFGLGEDGDDEESDQEFMEEELFNAVQLINRRIDDASAEKIFDAIVNELVSDGCALLGYESDPYGNDQVEPLSVEGENGSTLMVVYSCERAAENDHVKYTESFPLINIMRAVLHFKMNGIMFDPLDASSNAIFTSDIILKILEAFEEDEDDGNIPDFLA